MLLNGPQTLKSGRLGGAIANEVGLGLLSADVVVSWCLLGDSDVDKSYNFPI